MTFVEDGLHSGSRDRLDAEFSQLTNDEGVTLRVLTGQFQDQFADVTDCAGSTSWLGWLFASDVGGFGLPNHIRIKLARKREPHWGCEELGVAGIFFAFVDAGQVVEEGFPAGEDGDQLVHIGEGVDQGGESIAD